ncbi:hypothetical protein NQZ68_032197 [Dissostichus eleginoides]|nr:hypothetical protein NQZ68_032197 [Dissostichus eleginoides]
MSDRAGECYQHSPTASLFIKTVRVRDVLPSQPSETGPPVSIQPELEPVGHCNRSQP